MIYFFVPVNDFTENDRRWWNSKFNKFRHRPYFRKIKNVLIRNVKNVKIGNIIRAFSIGLSE